MMHGPFRYFVDQGFELCVAQSFRQELSGCMVKELGLSILSLDQALMRSNTIQRIASQLAILQRSEISNPPAYGARIASTVLNDSAFVCRMGRKSANNGRQDKRYAIVAYRTKA